MFAASFSQPTTPEVVAEVVSAICGRRRLAAAHPAGADAAPFLGWRAGMTGEEWLDCGALDDNAGYQRVRNDFAINARLPG